MSNELDALMAEINEMDSSEKDDSDSSDSSSSGSDSGSNTAVDINVDDLDDLIADIESQGDIRRRIPTKNEQPVGARKTTSRKNPVQGALEGNDLDRILSEIIKVTKQRAERDKNLLGWGVVSTERTFDLLAPKFVLIGSTVTSTLIASTTNGERTRVPDNEIKVNLKGSNEEVKVRDNVDGTYTLEWNATHLGTVSLQIEVYGQPQFDYPIQICGLPDAKKTSARALLPVRVHQKGEILVEAKDSRGEALQVGGAKFGLSFNGAGQLQDVGLLDKMDGTYSLTFVPNAPGAYAVWITLDGEDIAVCPVDFVVQ